MIPLTSFLLPIAASTAGCFVASSILWMAAPHHKGDYKALPDEDGVLGALKNQGSALKRGLYMIPYCNHDNKDAMTKALAKTEALPFSMAQLIVGPKSCSMGKSLGLWAFHLLLVMTIIAYIAGLAVKPGADFMSVAQVVGSLVLLTMGGGLIPDVAWRSYPPRNAFVALIDIAVYIAIACTAFGLLWPKA